MSTGLRRRTQRVLGGRAINFTCAGYEPSLVATSSALRLPRHASSPTRRTHSIGPTWMLRNLANENPPVWMAEVKGWLADLRATGTHASPLDGGTAFGTALSGCETTNDRDVSSQRSG
jgi:hypothetical protein